MPDHANHSPKPAAVAQASQPTQTDQQAPALAETSPARPGAREQPRLHRAVEIAALQRSVGNRAVGQLLRGAGGRTDTARSARTVGDGLIRRVLDPVPYNTSYNGPLSKHKDAVGLFINHLNQLVDNAYQQSLQWQTLAQHGDAHVKKWHRTAQGYASDPDQEPTIINANFGYAIESLACQGLNNSQFNGLTVQTQVGHGHTRPDVVLSVGDEEVAWLDITSVASQGHILGKDGAGWKNRPFVFEIVYPQLQLRTLLDATGDAFFQEMGQFLANERQVELMVKEGNRNKLRAAFLKLANDNNWTTGSHKADKKRQATRDFFIQEAANEGVEEEAKSMKMTVGALKELGINPGPYGFNRGKINPENERVKQVIDAASAEDIKTGKIQLTTETIHRIIGELIEQGIPKKLLNQLQEDFEEAPGDRDTARAAMALKGAAQDLTRLQNVEHHIHTMMPIEPRVKQLEQDVQQHLGGPQAADYTTIAIWRTQERALEHRAEILTRAIRAANELHKRTTQMGMNLFNRPGYINAWFGQLAQNHPDMQTVRAVEQWLQQQAQQQQQQAQQQQQIQQQ